MQRTPWGSLFRDTPSGSLHSALEISGGINLFPGAPVWMTAPIGFCQGWELSSTKRLGLWLAPRLSAIP